MASAGGGGGPPAPLVSPAGGGGGGGGPELVVALAAAEAERQGAVALTCTSLGGTTVAVLEVERSQSVLGLVGLLSERLEALLARSSDWTQRLRLAYPDGSLLSEPVDPSLTVEELLRSQAWLQAEARSREEGELPSPAATPSATPSRSGRARMDSRAKLEGSLKRLQEAKNLPLTAKAVPSTGPAPSPSPQEERPGDSGEGDGPGGTTAAAVVVAAALAAGAAAHAAPPPPAAAAGGAARQAAARGSATDPASSEAGGRVLLVSSLDGAHPGDNVIDGSEKTYWLSTGLYPQEILLELGRPSRVAGVRLSATNVRGVRIEGCSESAAVQFETLCSGELEACAGCLQRKELRCSREQAAPMRFVKTMILSGWHDFCSVHRIVVVE